MIELDRTNQIDRYKILSGILKRKVDADAYTSYLKLNQVKNWETEKKHRAELKQRGYSLRACPVFKAISKKDIIQELIKGLLNN